MSRSATRSNVGHRDGRGQPGVVRRLRADRGFGERARRTIVVHSCRTVGGCRCPGRGGDIAELVGRWLDEYPWWARWFGSTVGHQLRGSSGQRVGGADPIPVPEVDGSPSDATHRGHRASSAWRVGSAGRRWRCRLPCRGQHRPTGEPVTFATTHTGADCTAAASRAGGSRPARHGVAWRGDLRWRADGSADHRCTESPTTTRLRRSPDSIPARQEVSLIPATAPGWPYWANRDRAPHRRRGSRIAHRCR